MKTPVKCLHYATFNQIKSSAVFVKWSLNATLIHRLEIWKPWDGVPWRKEETTTAPCTSPFISSLACENSPLTSGGFQTTRCEAAVFAGSQMMTAPSSVVLMYTLITISEKYSILHHQGISKNRIVLILRTGSLAPFSREIKAFTRVDFYRLYYYYYYYYYCYCYCYCYCYYFVYAELTWKADHAVILAVCLDHFIIIQCKAWKYRFACLIVLSSRIRLWSSKCIRHDTRRWQQFKGG